MVTEPSVGVEDLWFVEVDLSTERRGALETKLAVYLAYFRSGKEQAVTDVFPSRVIWLVPDRARRQFLEESSKAGAPEALHGHRNPGPEVFTGKEKS
ncbi:MAG: replication-relaxation family protein [Solirubrobacterales bacterium]|nr:replication-relaxation family protein [Solirubrobacterales bacterium]